MVFVAASAYTVGHWQQRVVPELRAAVSGSRAEAFGDFDCYLHAARELRDGRSPYTKEFVQLPGSSCLDAHPAEYVYPPTLALILLPLSRVEPCTLEKGWLVLNLAACLLLVPLLVAVLSVPRVPWAYGLIIFLVGAPMATLENLTLGQVNFFLLDGILLGWLLYQRGHRISGGVLLGMAAAIKITPLVFAAEPLRRREFRYLAALAAVILAVVLAGFLPMLPRGPAEFCAAVEAKSLTQFHMPNNASLHAAMARAWFAPQDAGQAVIVSGLGLVLFGSLVCYARQRSSTAPTNVALAFLLTATLCVSPQLEAHHLVFLYPVHIVLAGSFWKSWRRREAVLGLAGLLLLGVLLNSRGLSLPDDFPASVRAFCRKPAGIAVWIEWLLVLRILFRRDVPGTALAVN